MAYCRKQASQFVATIILAILDERMVDVMKKRLKVVAAVFHIMNPPAELGPSVGSSNRGLRFTDDGNPPSVDNDKRNTVRFAPCPQVSFEA